jgi:hypothetical protein
MIIDILAGKMNFDGKKVSPDPRKGLLRLVIDGMTDRVTLQWLNREVNPPAVENEWTGPVTVEEVPSAKSGKVYVIKPNGSTDKHFVWIQQSSTNAVAAAAGFTGGNVDNVDAVMNQIQMLSQMSSGKTAMEIFSQAFGDDEVADDQMMLDFRGALEHDHDEEEEYSGDDEEREQMELVLQHLMEAAGGDSMQVGDVLTTLLSNPEILQILLAQLMVGLMAIVEATPSLLSQLQVSPPTETVKQTELSTIITTPEAIASITSSESSVIDRLAALCPPGQTDLGEILRSPQFAETLRNLTEGIYSDQLSLLVASLGLDQSELLDPSKDPLETLCRLLERKYKK